MDAEQRARDLLAEEYRRDGNEEWAHFLMKNGPQQGAEVASVRAITRALTQAQPGWRVVPVEVSEEMHVAACKVLLRAPGLDGLPQRMLDAMLAAAPEPGEGVTEKYEELLYAVARKFPGESRHETALRYIRQAENQVCGSASAAQQQGEG